VTLAHIGSRSSHRLQYLTACLKSVTLLTYRKLTSLLGLFISY